MPQMSFAQIGTLYNSISNELEGGVTPQNQQLLLQQVSTVQTQLQGLINNGTFNGFADPVTGNPTIVHAQNIADQMNFLSQEIQNFGQSTAVAATNANTSAPKFINDVVRDVQDIVAGDPNLTTLATQNNAQGFKQISQLLTQPTPFPDTPVQTNTLLQFISDSNSLATRAQALAGADPNGPKAADIKALVSDVQTFTTNANAYSLAQGGVFSDRFNNEFNTNGVQGTASAEMIKGLQTGNAALVNGAATVLQANAMDVRGNMLVQGQAFTAAPNGGIPTVIPDVHTAGMIFNDATTRIVGGVDVNNQKSLVNDLNATVTGLQNAINNQHLSGQALGDAQHAIAVLGNEANLVGGINTANPTQVSQVNALIHNDHTQVLNLINNDPTLAKLANGGFTPNPADGSSGPGQGPTPGELQHLSGLVAMLDSGNPMAATPAIPATPATPAIPHPGMAATPAIPATPATPAVPAANHLEDLHLQQPHIDLTHHIFG